MPEPVEGTSPYVPGLDGLRAIAVLAVIAYHLNFGWAQGGLLGVGVFFVLSGYLITDLLASQFHRHGGIGLKQFWVRRARRLLPALFVMLFVVVGWVTLFDRMQLPGVRSDLPAAVFYLSNWWFIFHHVSYFASFGPPSPLGHLWSLAIEEQFYLVWPLVILAGLRWVRSRHTLIALTLLAAAASAVEMALLYSPDGNPTRIYDGTDTRAFALLIGAALALAWPRAKAIASVTPAVRRTLELAGAGALVGIIVLFGASNQYQSFLYRGGMVLLSVLTALVIAVVVHPGTRMSRALGWGPLRWLGARSYGIYLWHYPVIVLTTPTNAQPDLGRATMQVGASIVAAALSWRYVEEPIRHGALGRQWAWVRRHGWQVSWESVRSGIRASIRPGVRPLVVWTVAATVAANAVLCTVGLFGLVSSAEADPATQVTSVAPPMSAGHARRPTLTLTSAWPPTMAPRVAPTPAPAPAPSPPPAALPGQGVTTIGDSVMVDAAPYLQQLLPGIVVDGQVGRQLYQAQTVVNQLRAAGQLGNRVVIELGTNGPFSTAQLVSLLTSLGPVRQIVLVNTRVPRPWQDQVNTTIAWVAAVFPHTTLVHWHADSAGKSNYFYPDGVHLDPQGAAYYASLIVQALQ